MIRNYIIIAVRNINRQKLYAVINVGGLAIGLACCVLVILFVQREFAYNQFHTKSDRIYRSLRGPKADVWQSSGGVSGLWGPTLEAEFPEVESTMRTWGTDIWITANDRVFEEDVAVVDPGYFQFFDFKLIKGDPTTALREHGGAVISESMAKRFFGTEDPIGRSLQFEDIHFDISLKVTGVMEDRYHDTSFHLYADCVTATIGQGLGRDYFARWDLHSSWRPIVTYVLLREGADIDRLREQLPNFMLRHLGEAIAEKQAYRLQSLNRVYIYGNGDGPEHWAMQRVRLYALIAFGILLIACVNFMNLATARSMLRSREVGMRKAIGARRRQLVAQFLTESIIMSSLALLVGIGMAYLILPTFQAYVGDALSLDLSTILRALPYLLTLTVLTGLVAGSYPAFVLARAQVLVTLRGDQPGGSAGLVRKGLVVLQFAVAILLLVGTLTIQDQVNYMTGRPMGIDRENVLMVPLYEVDRQITPNALERVAFQNETVKAEFLAHPDVLKASAGRWAPGIWPGMRRKVRRLDRPEDILEMYVQEADKDFVDLFGLNLVAGRNFLNTAGDSLSYIINRSAADMLGWENPIGQQLEWMGSKRKIMTIVGVVEDYQNRSLHQAVAPGAILPYPPLFFHVHLKIREGSLGTVLPHLEAVWKRFLPNRPFRYQLHEQEFRFAYWSEFELQETTRIFCALAILLACLGLYGLASFTAERRTKEIGIRKVLGASVGGLLGLIAREFAQLVLIANLIAWPLAYLYLNSWLNDFVQRIDLSPVSFLIGGIAVLVIAMVTISLRTYSAAQTNPVEAIRTE